MIKMVRPDLAVCEQEPIHTPGAIQPHGALLAALTGTMRVTHASANLSVILGRSAESVLGQSLERAIGEPACRSILDGRSSADAAPGLVHLLPGVDGGLLGLRAHRSGRHVCIDIEPIPSVAGQGAPVILAQAVLETFRNATTRDELCALAVRGLRALTGYDRVMAYRFHDDGHGEVIAEDVDNRLKPFLGLHYPASDVPPQARRLYARQSVGAIADANYVPVPLLIDTPEDGAVPLDLTHSALRSASPVHREYMRNMHTAASLTIGLGGGSRPNGGSHEGRPAEGRAHPATSDGDLWGMFVCHHATPRIAGPDVRAVAGMIGQVVSLLLASLGEAEVYAEKLARNATLRGLVARLADSAPLPEILAGAAPELLRLVYATGALLRLDGTTVFLGRTPPAQAAERALTVVGSAAAGHMVAVDDLGVRHPELAESSDAGALLMPLTPDTGDAILWFRPELARTVTWGGDPAGHATVDPATGRLSPRASFTAWKETVTGRSAPWTEADLELAGALRGAIETAIAQRNKAELAQLRYYDSLTGLPNRSLLRERLEEAATDPRADATLLFLDLDRFKMVNDTMGHAAGDALLVEVARRLTEAAGPEQLTARLGGDEFVVLCHGLEQSAIATLGETIRSALEAPFEILGRTCHISASIGIASASRAGDLDLVRAADMAMYAAKQRGGNAGVTFEAALFDHAAQQFEFDHELREALRGGDQLSLLYQPIFAVASGSTRLIGFEALSRWRHPRHGWMSPAQFLPMAEKSGLILPLGDWALATALREARALGSIVPRDSTSGQSAPLWMTVNVSFRQLSQPGFHSGLTGLLEAEGIPPSALCLEVAEDILADTAATAVLAGLRVLGVRVASDDFGIGHASLSFLRRLPLDCIKLDRDFLEEIGGDARGAEFAAAVVGLAHAAGKPVVFERIETQAQYDMVLASGADMAQGFFFAPPLSANAAEAFVATRRRSVEHPSTFRLPG
jgi:diguanylate cyclase (GGDEF)-like protein